MRWRVSDRDSSLRQRALYFENSRVADPTLRTPATVGPSGCRVVARGAPRRAASRDGVL